MDLKGENNFKIKKTLKTFKKIIINVLYALLNIVLFSARNVCPKRNI